MCVCRLCVHHAVAGWTEVHYRLQDLRFIRPRHGEEDHPRQSGTMYSSAARLEHSDACVRREALAALREAPEAVMQYGEALSVRLEDSDAGEREAALEALRSSPEAVMQHGEALSVRLEDSDAVVRRAALKALRSSPEAVVQYCACLLYTSPSPRDRQKSRMPSSA